MFQDKTFSLRLVRIFILFMQNYNIGRRDNLKIFLEMEEDSFDGSVNVF